MVIRSGVTPRGSSLMTTWAPSGFDDTATMPTTGGGVTVFAAAAAKAADAAASGAGLEEVLRMAMAGTATHVNTSMPSSTGSFREDGSFLGGGM
jgi:hypothetical protein